MPSDLKLNITEMQTLVAACEAHNALLDKILKMEQQRTNIIRDVERFDHGFQLAVQQLREQRVHIVAVFGLARKRSSSVTGCGMYLIQE